jgi:hypothetical protein
LAEEVRCQDEEVGRIALPADIDRSDDELNGKEETDIDIGAAAVTVTTLAEAGSISRARTRAAQPGS